MVPGTTLTSGLDVDEDSAAEEGNCIGEEVRLLTLALPVVSKGSEKEKGSCAFGGEDGHTRAAGNGSSALTGGGGGI